jgi:hypothetical protein
MFIINWQQGLWLQAKLLQSAVGKYKPNKTERTSMKLPYGSNECQC